MSDIELALQRLREAITAELPSTLYSPDDATTYDDDHDGTSLITNYIDPEDNAEGEEHVVMVEMWGADGELQVYLDLKAAEAFYETFGAILRKARTSKF